MLLGPDAFERLAGAALDQGGPEQVEVLVQAETTGLTRFANSQIHQNVWTQDISVGVRVATEDGRVGVATVHTDDPAVVAATAKDARELARVSPPDPDFPGLAPLAAAGEVAFDGATASASPEERARVVHTVLAQVPDDMEAAGFYTTEATEVGVYTSAGQRAYTPLSAARLALVVSASSSSGWAEAGGRSAAEVDAADAGRRAVAKARHGADPVEVDAGAWPVVLEPTAVQALVEFLAYLGFSGKAFLEGRSFACDRIGERVVDEAVTLFDDARSPFTIGLPFDFEGTPKQRVELITGGVLRGVAHDRDTGRRAGTASTGHGLPAPNTLGPIPLNAMLAPGDGGTVDDLVADMDRGLLVTRLHYVNPVHPVETSITGMTRDGTFLVTDGQVGKPVRNLRFTQSILEALSGVEAIGSHPRFATEILPGGSYCPPLRLSAFHFTGTTSFG